MVNSRRKDTDSSLGLPRGGKFDRYLAQALFLEQDNVAKLTDLLVQQLIIQHGRKLEYDRYVNKHTHTHTHTPLKRLIATMATYIADQHFPVERTPTHIFVVGLRGPHHVIPKIVLLPVERLVTPTATATASAASATPATLIVLVGLVIIGALIRVVVGARERLDGVGGHVLIYIAGPGHLGLVLMSEGTGNETVRQRQIRIRKAVTQQRSQIGRLQHRLIGQGGQGIVQGGQGVGDLQRRIGHGPQNAGTDLTTLVAGHRRQIHTDIAQRFSVRSQTHSDRLQTFGQFQVLVATVHPHRHVTVEQHLIVQHRYRLHRLHRMIVLDYGKASTSAVFV